MRTSIVLAFAGLAAAQAPPTITSVVNAGSNDARFCTGLLVTISGTNFGNVASAVSVVVGGQAAGIVSVENNVIVAQLPWSISSGLTVSVNGVVSEPFNVSMDSYAPAFYGDLPFGTTSVTLRQSVTATLVGLGQTNPLIPVGVIASAPAPTVVKPTVTVNGEQAVVITSAMSTVGVGLYQVTFTPPADVPLGTPLDVVLSIGGKSTPKKTLIVNAPTGAPVITKLVNAGNPNGGFSPGVLVSVTGFNFDSPTVAVGSPSKLAYVVQSTSTSMLVELPVDMPVGQADFIVTSGTTGLKSAPMSLSIDLFAPAFYGVFRDGGGTPYSASNPASPGKRVTVQLVGLGSTNPNAPTGVALGGQAPTTAQPTVTVGGKAAAFSYCGAASGLVGVYELDFTVPEDAPAGTPDVILTIGGHSTPAVPLATAPLVPSLIGFKNAASGQLKDSTHGIAPNTFLSIYATNAGSADSTGNLFPATEFQATRVLVNGNPIPLYNVVGSANLINVVVPSELPESGTANVTIVNKNGSSQNFTLNLSATDVGIFRIPADASNPSRQIAAATIANTAWIVMPAATATSYKYSPCPSATPLASCAGPAHPGDSIVIYFTGGGRTTPQQVPTGSVAPVDGSVIYRTAATPSLKIGGIDAPILFSGISPGTAAEYQINTVIPAGVATGDDVPVVLTIGGTSDTVTIAVQK